VAVPRGASGRSEGSTALSLEDLRAEADRYAAAAYAPRTRKARQQDWESFERWCAINRIPPLPTTAEMLRLYLTHLVMLGRKASTIRRARSSIGLMHEQVGAARPDRTTRTREVERGIGNLHGAHEEGATPLLEHEVATIVATLKDSPRDLRDRALILLGFFGGFRASELCGLMVDDVTFTKDGATVLVARSKEDQQGKGGHTNIHFGASPTTCPIEALKRWMQRVGRPAGPVFRVIEGAQIEHQRISERAVSRAVQRAGARAGLSGHYSSHSLRKGLCTSAFAAGATKREIQLHCRMKSERTLDRYLFPELVPGRRNVAAGLL
jgi:site-specific recombinase XerD